MPTLPVFGSESVSGMPISCVTVSHVPSGNCISTLFSVERTLLAKGASFGSCFRYAARYWSPMPSMHFLSQEAAKDGTDATASVAMPAATMTLFTQASSDEAVETAEYFFFVERSQRRTGTHARRRNVRCFETGDVEIGLIEMERHDRCNRLARRSRCHGLARPGGGLPAARRLRTSSTREKRHQRHSRTRRRHRHEKPASSNAH